MSEWQPIKTAPKDGTKFLGFDPDGTHGETYAVIGWYVHKYETFEPVEGTDHFKKVEGETCWWDGAPYTPFHATHWMPLAAPPSA